SVTCSTYLTHSSAAPLHLPSFPTRRSSDLHDRLHGGPVQLAVLSAAIGLGSVPPSILLALRPGPPRWEGRQFYLSTIGWGVGVIDRKSTRLNSSHRTISYAVFCLKKKKLS